VFAARLECNAQSGLGPSRAVGKVGAHHSEMIEPPHRGILVTVIATFD
jgi:hypothetical protein